MDQVSVHSIMPALWRWELRCSGAALRCSTAPTRVAAERTVSWILKLGQVPNEG
ncbi:MAG: hypothetical protein ACYC6Y_06050 [Thermoguttaceae bacterium]